MRLVHHTVIMSPKQLESLYDEFAPAMHAFALQLARERETARDILQSVFLRLAGRPRFTILNPRSFLLRCTYRAYVDLVRRESARQRVMEEFALEPLDGFQVEPEGDERLADLLAKVDLLPEEQRAVLHLKIWENRTFRQFADILSIPANTAANRFRYAIEFCIRGFVLSFWHPAWRGLRS